MIWDIRKANRKCHSTHHLNEQMFTIGVNIVIQKLTKQIHTLSCSEFYLLFILCYFNTFKHLLMGYYFCSKCKYKKE